jgi:hypothetical protein
MIRRYIAQSNVIFLVSKEDPDLVDIGQICFSDKVVSLFVCVGYFRPNYFLSRINSIADLKFIKLVELFVPFPM